jgi:Phytanoyl-CoA dioxygenase (PhyH)
MGLGRKIRNLTQAVLDPRYRHMYWQRSIENRQKRAELATNIATALPKFSGHRSSLSDQFEKDGFVDIKNLATAEEIKAIRTHLFKCQSFDPFRKELGLFMAPDDAPLKTHIAHFSVIDVVNTPHVLKIANNPEVLNIVGNYFGCKPTISYMAAWWSLPCNDGAQHAENFHRDYDDLKFAKLFLYLTDVDEDCGPHVFVKGSHNSDKLIKRKRYEDKEVLENFPDKSDHLRLIGKAGTAFVETTFGLHRGVPPTKKPRLLLQVLYSLKPNIGGPKKPIADRSTKCVSSLDQYINRIYCNFT